MGWRWVFLVRPRRDLGGSSYIAENWIIDSRRVSWLSFTAEDLCFLVWAVWCCTSQIKVRGGARRRGCCPVLESPARGARSCAGCAWSENVQRSERGTNSPWGLIFVWLYELDKKESFFHKVVLYVLCGIYGEKNQTWLLVSWNRYIFNEAASHLMFLAYEDKSLRFEDLHRYITTRETNVCFDPKHSCIVFITVLLRVVQVLLLSSFYSQVRYHFCLLPALPDESLPYKWLWILHYVFRNVREMCFFFFSAKVTEMPSVLSAKLLCRVSAKLKKKLTLCFLLLLRILNYSICSLTLIICLLSTFFSLSLFPCSCLSVLTVLTPLLIWYS